MSEKSRTSSETPDSPNQADHEKTSLPSDSDSHSSKGSTSEHRQQSSLKLYIDQSPACSSGYSFSSTGAAHYVEPTDGSVKMPSKVTIDLKNEQKINTSDGGRTSLLSDSNVASPDRKSSKAGGREIRLHYSPETRTADLKKSRSFDSQVQLHQVCAVPRSKSADHLGREVNDEEQVLQPLEDCLNSDRIRQGNPSASYSGKRVHFLLPDSSSNLTTSSGSPPPINNRQIGFERRPVEAWCRKCRKIIRTSTKTRPHNWDLFCMVVFCTCCWVLFFMPDLFQTQHKCPDCKYLIAMYPDISDCDE